MEIIAASDAFSDGQTKEFEEAENFVPIHVPDSDISDLSMVLDKEPFPEYELGDLHFVIVPFPMYHAMLRPSVSSDTFCETEEFTENGDIIYGEYPQTIETDNAAILENKYHQKHLEETGKTYHLCFLGDRKNKEYPA